MVNWRELGVRETRAAGSKGWRGELSRVQGSGGQPGRLVFLCSQREFVGTQTECGKDGAEQSRWPRSRERMVASSGSFMARDLWERVGRAG
jgi:hypothetical protein